MDAFEVSHGLVCLMSSDGAGKYGIVCARVQKGKTNLNSSSSGGDHDHKD